MGKTLLTASLLLHLRQNGLRALAMKPCCCGGRADVDLIQAIQGSDPHDAGNLLQQIGDLRKDQQAEDREVFAEKGCAHPTEDGRPTRPVAVS